jgi:hypothetical protein
MHELLNIFVYILKCKLSIKIQKILNYSLLHFFCPHKYTYPEYSSYFWLYVKNLLLPTMCVICLMQWTRLKNKRRPNSKHGTERKAPKRTAEIKMGTTG